MIFISYIRYTYNICDRFYSLLLRFRYSTSPNIGSHTFYSIEAGVPFFLLGSYPEYHIKNSSTAKAALPDGKRDLSDYGDPEDVENFLYLKQLLSVPGDEITEEQRKMVTGYLGCGSSISRLKASMVLWRELILNLDQLVSIWVKIVLRIASKLNPARLARQKK